MKPGRTKANLSISGILGIGQTVSWGITYYLPAVLFEPLLSEFDWDKSKVIAAFSIALVVSGICAPFVGRTVKEISGKKVLSAGSMIIALGLFIMGNVTNYYQFILAWVILGVGMSTSLYPIAFSTLAQIFGKNARKAITTITIFGALASTLAWPFGTYFIDQYGWRELCILYSAISFLFVLPLYHYGLPNVQDIEKDERKVSASEAVEMQRAPYTFLTFGTNIVSFSFISATLSVFLLITLIDTGYDPVSAALIASLMGPAQLLARVLERFTPNDLNPVWILMTASLSLLFGVTLMGVGGTFVILGVILFGIGKGLISIAKGTVLLFLFGPTDYSLRLGKLERYVMFTQASAPVIAGWIYVQFGMNGMIALLFCLALGSVPTVFWLLRSSRVL